MGILRFVSLYCFDSPVWLIEHLKTITIRNSKDNINNDAGKVSQQSSQYFT